MASQPSALVRSGQIELDEDLAAEQAQPPGPRLSFVRVLSAVAALGVLVAGGAWALSRHVASSGGTALVAASDRAWFAPYVDTTLPPYLQFQDPAVNPAAHVVLGFVVADKHNGCSPSWGGAYSLDGAAQTLALDRRIAEYRTEGGDPIVSFGGQANSELATTCSSATSLETAYRSVVDRYQLDTIDLDIEGSALYDVASIERRDQALVDLQQTTTSDQPPLKVWVTLPVAPDGLPSAADQLVARMLRDRVTLAGVNVMAMDYGTPQGDMLADAEDAVTATARQVATAYQQAGEPLTSSAVWRHLGVTAMIGVNDTPGETFTTQDATALTRFASEHGMGRMSIWSLNRDAACTTATFTGAAVHSNTCSGVRQTSVGEFSKTMAKLSPSSATANAAGVDTAGAADPIVAKDPANSPYPAWRAWPAYVQGYRVERNGNIYEAKWQNSATDPLAETGANPNPWQLLGPVLPSDHAPRITTLVSGSYPQWSPARHYQTGTIVTYHGLPYAAQWFTVGTSPAASSLGANASPWLPLFDVEGEPSAANSSTFALQGIG